MCTSDQANSSVEKGRVNPPKPFLSKLFPPDIFDAVYAFSSEEMNILALPASALQKRGVTTRLAAFLYWMTKEIRFGLTSKRTLNNAKLANRTAFFYSSLNEKRALESVASLTDNAIVISAQIGEPNKLNFAVPYLLAIIYSPWVAFKFLLSTGYRRRSFDYALDQYLFSCGYVIYLRFILSKNRPSLAVVSNDHSMLSRSFALVCRELSIPVAYIQHASVSERFPELIFDYAFLDGMDALDKYGNKGLGACTVFLSGISKLDDALTRLHKCVDVRTCISICPNSMDEVSAVMAAAKFIQDHVDTGFKVCLRPHPGDKRRFGIWREAANQIGIEYSAPEIDCSSELLLKSRFVLAADSNILLEAALLKAVPISMPFTGKILDHYGFIRRGVALHAQNPAGAVEIIKATGRDEAPYFAAKYFSHIAGTTYEGATSKLIASTLSELAAGRGMSKVWHSYASGVFEVN